MNTDPAHELRKYKYFLQQRDLQEEVLRCCLAFLHEFKCGHAMYHPLEQLHAKSGALMAQIEKEEQ